MPWRNTVKEHRLATGESLRKLGAAVGMDATQLSRVERGAQGCGHEFMGRLAEHFGVSVDALFFVPGVDKKSPNLAAVAARDD